MSSMTYGRVSSGRVITSSSPVGCIVSTALCLFFSSKMEATYALILSTSPSSLEDSESEIDESDSDSESESSSSSVKSRIEY